MNVATETELRRLIDLRADESTGVELVVIGDPPGEAVANLRTSGMTGPLGLVGIHEADAFSAISVGADDACVGDGLDLPRLIAFLDRVALRARQRRENENQQAAAAHAEKLAALGTVVAGVAHEINNPLGVIVLVNDSIRSSVTPLLTAQGEIFRLAERETSASADELRQLADMAVTGAAPSELRAALDDVDTALRTITDIVRDLRIFARSDSEERPEPVYLPDLVDHVLRIVGKQISAIATLERDYDSDVPVLLLPRSRLTQVLTNLLINAAHATAEVRRRMHRVRISIRADAESIALSISDTGPGIPPQIIERIFDPFFTTKRGEGTLAGTGLGLSISRAILRVLGGDLIVESVHGEGATFIAIIPTAGRKDVRDGRETGTVPPPSSGRASVLVVEDDESLLRTLANALRRRFHVILAADGQEAVDLLASGTRPSAILCDITLPVIDGPGLFEWLQGNRPDLARRVIFMSANAAAEANSKFAAQADRPLIEKPVARDKLIAVLETVIGPP